MNDRDDLSDLDRMLAALPLEESPAGLHARIMGATVFRPEPVVRPWETWLIGTMVALTAWLAWLVVASPDTTGRFTALAADALADTALASPSTLLWLAVGLSAAWWVSQLSVPVSRRVKAE